MRTIECVAVEVIEPGGVLLDAADANVAPVPTGATEGTASVKLIGVAKKAAATEPEVLEPRAEGDAYRSTPRESPSEGEHEPQQALQACHERACWACWPYRRACRPS